MPPSERLSLPAYRAPARLLHWVTAILVIATFPVGVAMIQQGLERPTQDALFIFHKNVGVLIFLLVLARLAWRIASPPPPLPASLPRWQRAAAGISHVLLYVLLLVMTVSGYLYVVAGGFPIESLDALGVPRLVPRSEEIAVIARRVHVNARFALFAVVLIHIAAALQHAIRRDGVFSRMAFWPLGRRS